MSLHSNYGYSVQASFVSRIRELDRVRSERINALGSRSEAEAYVREVREKIARVFDLPERPQDLHVEVTGIVDMPECRVEKTIYYSRKKYPVTALLYIPKRICGKAPGVLFLSGHSPAGKNGEPYFICCRNLAAQGYVVLAPDPVSQGERSQFVGVPNSAGASGGGGTNEHNMLGKQLGLTGELFGSWRVHDAICGLDYLLTRPEVDASRIGVTGNSGGGTLTTFTQALDPRVTMAAPSCYVTSWRRNIENELPADSEQCPYGILAAGCEMGDFVLAYAPRPILLLGQENDFFDKRGLMETFEECRKVYRLLGAEENLQLFIGPVNHGYHKENRQAMYAFFGKHAGVASDVSEVTSPAPETKEFFCAPGGQVVNLPGCRLAHDIILEKAERLASMQPEMDSKALRFFLIRYLGLPEEGRVPVPYRRTLRPEFVDANSPRSFIISRFMLEGKDGVPAILKVRGREDHYQIPQMEEMTLVLAENDAVSEMWQMDESMPLAGVELRGIGEVEPMTCDTNEPSYYPYGRKYHYDVLAKMFGSSTLALRVHDLLGVIAALEEAGTKRLHLLARGEMSVPAALAALIHAGIADVTLQNAPESWLSMARARVTLWEPSVMPVGILKFTDLPKIYAALAEQNRLAKITFANELMQVKVVFS